MKPRFEYCHDMSVKYEHVTEAANKKAADGWELVSVVWQATLSYWVAFFKRELPPTLSWPGPSGESYDPH